MSHLNLFSPEFLSALAGAAVAAGATIFAQNRSFAHERKLRGVEKRVLDRKEADQVREATSVIAFSILTKINYAFTNIADIHMCPP